MGINKIKLELTVANSVFCLILGGCCVYAGRLFTLVQLVAIRYL